MTPTVSSTFGGLVQAGTGLTAATYGLQIVSQNIDNADTPGYTRQASHQVAVDGVTGVPSIYTPQAGLGGVNIASTGRMNDPVLDARARTEYARSGVADETATNLSSVESIFPEPSDNGVTEQLNDFWNAWTGVANDPGNAGNTASRSVLLGAATQVTSTLNAMSQSLSDASGGIEQTLNNTITTANSTIDQLNVLNKQIAVGNASGQSVNKLLDQRDTLLDQMASSVGAAYAFNGDGTVNVSVGGQAVVQWTSASGGAVNHLEVDPSSYDITTAAGSATDPSVPAIGGGGTATLTGGTALADQTAIATTIPAYLIRLDGVAQQLADAVNGQQAAGFDLTGNPGAPMFSYVAGGPAGSLAASLSVASGFTDADVAASATGADTDGNNALASSKLGTAAGSADKLYQALVGAIGQASKNAASASTTQASVTQSVDTLRTAASGVSTDEEMSNLLTYQRAYQASAKVISILDDMLDTLINGMGVG